MSIKNQLLKIKQNWLLVLLVVLLLFLTNISDLIPKNLSLDLASQEKAVSGSSMYFPYSRDFAPEVQDRKITKTSYLTSEIPSGNFQDADSKLKSIISSTESILLNENVQIYENSYHQASYQIKTPVVNYQNLILEVKKLGNVVVFTENSDDITSQHLDLKTELEAESSRLAKYQEMYSQAKDVSEKIQLIDQISQLERTISYLKDSLTNLENKVEYSTLYLTINEHPSLYSKVKIIKFSELISKLIQNINNLFSIVFILIPYLIAVFVLFVIVKLFKRRRF